MSKVTRYIRDRNMFTNKINRVARWHLDGYGWSELNMGWWLWSESFSQKQGTHNKLLFTLAITSFLFLFFVFVFVFCCCFEPWVGGVFGGCVLHSGETRFSFFINGLPRGFDLQEEWFLLSLFYYTTIWYLISYSQQLQY